MKLLMYYRLILPPTVSILSPMLYYSTVSRLLEKAITDTWQEQAVVSMKFTASSTRKRQSLESIAASVSSAELHLQDAREQYKESTNDTLQIIFLNAALIGNVKVLKWARDKGFDPEADDFMNASLDGHVAVVQWADDNDLDWFSDTFIDLAAQMGHACILEWAHSTGRAIPVSAAVTAASFGQCVVLTWMKEHDLLGSIQDLWRAASVHDHIDVLDWLFENGYRVHPDVISTSIISDRRNVLLWAREHGLAWDASTCALAAIRNDLSLLQWLRENDCPWDRIVIAAARGQGFEDIAQWAIDNGCPTE